MSAIPPHMAEAWDPDSFDPDSYREAECAHCGEPIYRYERDLIAEWKHFSHSAYCDARRAVPSDEAAAPARCARVHPIGRAVQIDFAEGRRLTLPAADYEQIVRRVLAEHRDPWPPIRRFVPEVGSHWILEPLGEHSATVTVHGVEIGEDGSVTVIARAEDGTEIVLGLRHWIGQAVSAETPRAQPLGFAEIAALMPAVGQAWVLADRGGEPAVVSAIDINRRMIGTDHGWFSLGWWVRHAVLAEGPHTDDAEGGDR